MSIDNIIENMIEGARASERQKKDFWMRLWLEDDGELNVTLEGFRDEIILPLIKWVTTRFKPG